MDYQEFQNSIEYWKKHLTNDQNLHFEELINWSKENERIRNLCVFYALRDKGTFSTFLKIAQQDQRVKQMVVDLNYALHPLYNPDSSLSSGFWSVARMLRNQPYYQEVQRLISKQKPTDASLEMRKFLNSLVCQYKLSHQSDEEKEYIQEKMSKYRKDDLLV